MEMALNQRLQIILEMCYAGNKSSLARAMGVEYQHINNWLKGKNLPNISTYLSLFDKVKDRINPIWFITGDGYELLDNQTNSSDNILTEKLNDCIKENQNLKEMISLKQRLLDSQDQVILLLQKDKK